MYFLLPAEQTITQSPTSGIIVAGGMFSVNSLLVYFLSFLFL